MFEETRLDSVRTSGVILRLLCAVKSNGKPLKGRHHQVSSINEKDGKDISLSTCLDKDLNNEANRDSWYGQADHPNPHLGDERRRCYWITTLESRLVQEEAARVSELVKSIFGVTKHV